MSDNEDDFPRDRLASHIARAMKQARARHLDREDKERIWNRIHKQSVLYGRAGRRTLWLRYGAAASVALFCSLTIGWLYFFHVRQGDNELIRTGRALHENLHDMDSLGLASDGNPVASLENETTLYFRDSSLTAVGPAGTKRDIVLDGPGDYTTMVVPYGKRTEIILPDSTKVWLNAGSYLTFSKNFMGKKREVFLQGEAFFEVTHMNQKPFYVYADDMQVKVLGTSFNVSSYKDDEVSSAVLVEGKIELTPLGRATFQKQVLSTGITATFNKTNGKLGLESAGAQDHIAWTRKRLVLKSAPLPDLIRKLERVYNAEIRYETRSNAADDRFSGIIDLRQSLEDVLRIIFEPSVYHIQQEGRRFVIN